MTTGAWARLRQRFGAPPRAQTPAALSLAQARAAIRDGQSGRALDLLLQASASTPHDADAWSLLGWVYHDLGNDGEARAATGRALAIDPDHLEALNTMGVMAGELADPMVSVQYFERALATAPDNAPTRYNLAQRLFFAGDYRRAFALLGARHVAHHGRDYPLAPLPIWQGEALGGKHVFVWCDWGGLGDHLQFARYVPLLRAHARPARLTLGCQGECLRLFAGLEGVDAVVAPGAVPAADVHAPLLDLPVWFDTGPENVPASIPYLAADAALADAWRASVAAEAREGTGPRIGLAWATGRWNQGIGYDRVRVAKSVPPALLAPLAGSGAQFVSLQKDAQELPPLPMVDPTARITDFADTAAIIAGLDVVVSADTAVAHLAGAMGKPVILMLRHEGGMFWSLGESTTPWYPSMTILRQRSSGNWNDVIDQAVRLLAAHA